MDAVEYIKQARRMCKWYNSSYGCGDCALYGRCAFKLSAELTDELIKESVKTVEQWVAEHPQWAVEHPQWAVEHPQWAVEHPQETRWTKLKKVCPVLNDNARKQICVRAFGYQCDCDMDCAKHWDVPVEE